jgi:hypothetical protein
MIPVPDPLFAGPWHCSLADACDGAWFHDRNDQHEDSACRHNNHFDVDHK